MPTTINTKLPRDLTVEERRVLFLDRKKRMAEEANLQIQPTRWHPLDHDMLPEQWGEIPDAPQGEMQTVMLWVKFHHPWLRKEVVSKGYFNFDGGDWMGTLGPEEEGWQCGRINPSGWAHIVLGDPPPEWEGIVIGERRDGS